MCIRDEVHFLPLSYSKISMKTQVGKKKDLSNMHHLFLLTNTAWSFSKIKTHRYFLNTQLRSICLLKISEKDLS